MKKYSYNRYTLRLSDAVDTYVKAESEKRGIAPTVFIKCIIADYRVKECAEHGEDRD